jgi:hypothetical protein
MNALRRLHERPGQEPAAGPDLSEPITVLAVRLHGEYREMPGMRLTVSQAARLFGTTLADAEAVLDHLARSRILVRAPDGAYALATDPSRLRPWAGRSDGGAPAVDPISAWAASVARDAAGLPQTSVERLAALNRHWTWADEAMRRFDHELAKGWAYGDGMSVHPFGAYAHWCALLCALADIALGQPQLSPRRLESVRPDLEASMTTLRSCRQLLAVVPATLDEHPRVADLMRDDTLPRLRRIHRAFGEAIREEQTARTAGPAPVRD